MVITKGISPQFLSCECPAQSSLIQQISTLKTSILHMLDNADQYLKSLKLKWLIAPGA